MNNSYVDFEYAKRVDEFFNKFPSTFNCSCCLGLVQLTYENVDDDILDLQRSNSQCRDPLTTFDEFSMNRFAINCPDESCKQKHLIQFYQYQGSNEYVTSCFPRGTVSDASDLIENNVISLTHQLDEKFPQALFDDVKDLINSVYKFENSYYDTFHHDYYISDIDQFDQAWPTYLSGYPNGIDWNNFEYFIERLVELNNLAYEFTQKLNSKHPVKSIHVTELNLYPFSTSGNMRVTFELQDKTLAPPLLAVENPGAVFLKGQTLVELIYSAMFCIYQLNLSFSCESDIIDRIHNHNDAEEIKKWLLHASFLTIKSTISLSESTQERTFFFDEIITTIEEGHWLEAYKNQQSNFELLIDVAKELSQRMTLSNTKKTTSTIANKQSHPSNITQSIDEKGKHGELLFQKYLDENLYHFIYLEQSPKTLAKAFKALDPPEFSDNTPNRLKRPDFLLILKEHGTLVVDVKNLTLYDNQGNVPRFYTLNLDEIQQAENFKSTFGVPWWWVFYAGGDNGDKAHNVKGMKSWYFISLAKVIELKANKDNHYPISKPTYLRVSVKEMTEFPFGIQHF